jgi:hypothetical protein
MILIQVEEEALLKETKGIDQAKGESNSERWFEWCRTARATKEVRYQST